MTRAIVLAVALFAVLAGAVIGARALLAAPITLPPPPPAAEPVVVAWPSVEAAPTRVVVQPAPAPVPTPVAVVQPAAEPPRAQQPPAARLDQAEEQPPEVPDHTVDEALSLVTSNQVLSPEQARSAAEIFAQCLRTRPHDARCSRGLRLANRRQIRALPLEQLPGRPGLVSPRSRRSAEIDPD